MPVPVMTPKRCGSSSSPISSPESSTACWLAAIAIWVNRSTVRTSFPSIVSEGSKPLASQANRVL
jgi:hypothetical protein